MKVYEFRVDGDPKPQPRTRIGRTKAGFSVAYDPGTAKSWKERINTEALKVRPKTPISAPVDLSVTIWFARPAGHYRTNGALKDWAPTFVAGKGRNDVDNLLKAVMDALNDIRFWEDDGLVVSVFAQKLYVDPGDRPGAKVRVIEMESQR